MADETKPKAVYSMNPEDCRNENGEPVWCQAQGTHDDGDPVPRAERLGLCKDCLTFFDTAYVQFLRAESKHNVNYVAKLILHDFTQGGELAQKLVDLTGDEKYTTETFIKAARLVFDSQLAPREGSGQ